MKIEEPDKDMIEVVAPPGGKLNSAKGVFLIRSKIFFRKYFKYVGNSPVVQWLGLRAFTAEDEGAIPGRGKLWGAAKKKGRIC